MSRDSDELTNIDLKYNISALTVAILTEGIDSPEQAFKLLEKQVIDTKEVIAEDKAKKEAKRIVFHIPSEKLVELRNQEMSFFSISLLYDVEPSLIRDLVIQYSEDNPDVFIYKTPAIDKTTLRAQYVELKDKGLTIKQIAKQYRVKENSVIHAIKMHYKTKGDNYND